MKKISVLWLWFVVTALSTAVFAQESPWLVRARGIYLDTANKSDPVGGAGASDLITVSNKWIPEVDVSYFFSPHWATELVLTYPQKHSVYVSGQSIGTVKHLPPTLTLQYHFAPQATLNPYLGAGLNYTRFSAVDLGNGAITLDKSSWGYALQGGLNYQLDKNWSLNLDVKYVDITSNVYAGGQKISHIKISPWLVGAGVGYRF